MPSELAPIENGTVIEVTENSDAIEAKKEYVEEEEKIYGNFSHD